ncbi:GNAT family N-acetyltransferase [Nonomuraea sp. NPDC002799]
MEIRPRTPEDLDACVKALAEVQAADRYPVDWPDNPAAWLTPDDLTGAWIAIEPTGEPGPTTGAGQTGAGPAVEPTGVLGHVALTRDAEITRLFLTPAARGHGLATRLLDTVRAAAATPLKLEVSAEGGAAIAFYERSGWRRVGSTRATWLNAAGEPALLHHYVSPPSD